MQKIVTFLWFDNQAEEAANFYVSIFKNSKIINTVRYSDAGPGPKGSVMTVTFELAGQQFMALNGGPHFHFSEAISLLINCETQQEVDNLWEKLSAGGKKITAAGSKINTVSPGKSSPPPSAKCSRTKIPRNLNASCKPCCKWTKSTLPACNKPTTESNLSDLITWTRGAPFLAPFARSGALVFPPITPIPPHNSGNTLTSPRTLYPATSSKDISMKAPFLIGRILFGGYFLYNGINHLQKAKEMAPYAESKGVPAAELAIKLSAVPLIVGGASILLGVKPKLGAMAILGFLAGVSPIMHDFWRMEDPSQRMQNMVDFMKNAALAGGALALMGVEEPWEASVPVEQLDLRKPKLTRKLQKLGRKFAA